MCGNWWEEVCVCVFVREASRSGRGQRDAAFFWMKLLHIRYPPFCVRIPNASSWLVEARSRWRQTDSLVDESARNSIHSGTYKRSAKRLDDKDATEAKRWSCQTWMKTREIFHWIIIFLQQAESIAASFAWDRVRTGLGIHTKKNQSPDHLHQVCGVF